MNLKTFFAGLATLAALATGSVHADVTSYRQVTIQDSGTGLDAFTMMVPSDWAVQSRTQWNLAQPAAPFNMIAVAATPDHTEGVGMLPSLAFTWSPQYARFGARVIQGLPVRPAPSSPIEGLEQALQGMMAQTLGSYTILSNENLPDVAAAHAPLYQKPGAPPMQIFAGKVRFCYQKNGVDEEGELVGLFLYQHGPAAVVWGIDRLSMVTAPQGSFEQELPKLNHVVLSFLPTPRFTVAMESISDMLVNKYYQDENAIMQRAAQQARSAAALSDEQMAHWQANESARFNAVENYDQGAIRGVVTRYNPATGEQVQVPTGAAHVYGDASGEVISTDSETFDPHSYKNVDWQELQLVQQ